MADYFSIQGVFESKLGRSTQFVDVVPDEFTVRRHPRFRTSGAFPSAWLETPIREVEVVSAEKAWSSEVQTLLQESASNRRVSNEEFAGRVFDALIASVEEVWIPDRFHLVLHSAGYDSRLLSLAIKELHERNGPNWLGQVFFVECGGEGEGFRRIMEIEGWPKFCYQVKEQNFDDCFDFSMAWQRMGAGTWAYPVNFWWDPVVWAQRLNIAPEISQMQCWSAQGANQIGRSLLRYSDMDFAESMWWGYFKIYSFAPLYGDWVFPFVDFRYIRALRDYGGGRSGNGYIEDVLNEVAPEFKGIPNIPPQDCLRKDMPGDLFAGVVEDYRNSWYGREVNADVRFEPIVNFYPWWGHYGVASYCEHARGEGRRIHVV